jgi:hypothetical protein
MTAMRTGSTKSETTVKEYVYFTHVYKMAQKSLPVTVHWLASVLMRAEMGFNSCFQPECASVFKGAETAAPRNFSSVQYHVFRD